MALARAGGPVSESGGYSAEQVAQVCHEANRVLQRLAGQKVSLPWASASPSERASAVAGVGFARQGTSHEALHRAWCAHKIAEGWQWGPVKDERAKRHPCLVPYDQLPGEERIKDAVFAAIVQAMG